jgi:hypothetical protein
MTAAIMQPYFLPYAGYFQLAAASETFVLCDNFQYTRKGWINRNRFLQNGDSELFSLPLQGEHRNAEIRHRQISPDFNPTSFLRRFEAAYRKSPNFSLTHPLLHKILFYQNLNLFAFLEHSVRSVCTHLGLNPVFKKTSDLPISCELQFEERLIAMCRALPCSRYINSIGGTALYSKESFRDHGIELQFLSSHPLTYRQFENPFVPSLSILDVLMFNPIESVRHYMRKGYDLF